MNRPVATLVLLATILSLTSCRSIMYSTYETFGVYKRDLLKESVVDARDEQKKAQEEFTDALTRLKELTGFDGGALEKKYRQLEGDYDDAAKRVAAVHKRVAEVETVAGDLFEEWDQENRQIQTDSLRRTSRDQLNATRSDYDQMLAALKDAERGMDPVLQKLHDYVLTLKHALNAQTISALRGESIKIQSDISRLLEDMAASIARADKFIQGMPQ